MRACSRPQPIQLDDFKFLKSATSRTAKVCIPSPSMMIVQGGEKIIDPKIYPDPDLFFSDLARVYAQEVADLASAGCKYLQLDDTFLAFLCDEKIGAAFGRSGEDTRKMARLSARLINDAIKDRPVRHGGHHPPVPRQLPELVAERGRLRPGRRDPPRRDRRRRIFPGVRRRALGQLRAAQVPAQGQEEGGAGPRAPPSTPQLESRDALKRRIDEAAKVVPIEQLAISPQCGFSSTADGNVISVEGQMEKLMLCVKVAREVWGGVAS